MGNKQSARVDIPEADSGEGGAESAAQRSPNGAAVYKFEDGAWSLQTAACNPEFDDEGDDNAPKWVMDVRARRVVQCPTECLCFLL